MNPVREAGKEYLMLNNSEEDSKITRMENSQQEKGKPRKVRKKDIIAKMNTGKGRGIPKITGKVCSDFQNIHCHHQSLNPLSRLISKLFQLDQLQSHVH